jgi:hypothetical protein
MSSESESEISLLHKKSTNTIIEQMMQTDSEEATLVFF